ncbi:hypothetical protein P171DRAFT_45458 [Karstenula rhodostoma CBS 690.94]|uniref:Apc15p protein-domain-containing protein n=1 Tax=Karstenula rhodostoma CBS 690.94 TaxID=1392251 RepID=A0A9P4PF28_9PLEO|nr:hypothetical protein P171DRAFT_45458 [Karstenula rhodostoma CBS 690.94]
MLSLPTIPPRADASLWPSLRKPHQTFDSDAPSQTHPHRRAQAHAHAHGAPTRSLFTQLLLDENKQKQRNANIRHFGATWIRPPGIQKTYQAMIDEEKEIKEQEALAMREQQMMDLAAAQQDAANAEARDAADEEIDEEERDLDDDVPEAAASGSESEVSASGSESEEGSVSGGEEEESRADVTFNEDSFIEGSMIEGRVGQMLAMEEASMEGSLLEERDLDDDVPEAGEYEHTDSSLLDSSDEDDGSFVQPGSRSARSRRSSGAVRSARSRRSSGVRSVRRTSGLVLAHPMGPTLMMGQAHAMGQAQAMGQLQAREQMRNSRFSLELEGSSSLMEGSSFLVSSPVAARGNVRARLFGARNQR